MAKQANLVRSREKFNRNVDIEKEMVDEYHKSILKTAEERQYQNVVVPVANTEETFVSKEQISFGTKYQKVSIFEKFKKKIITLERQFEHTPFWLNYLMVFTTVSSIFVSIVVSAYIVLQFNNLPDFMPLFYDHTKKTWDLVDKSLFLIIPVVMTIANLFLIRMLFIAYNFDRKFVYIAAITQILVNILQVIALVQLLSIVSVIKN